METELAAKLKDSGLVYLDIFSTGCDHVAHLIQDPDAQLAALEKNDAMLGFNLVDYLGTTEGGGHHVVTNRYPNEA